MRAVAKSAWRKIREREGIVCPVCGGITYYWKADKECFECNSCQHWQSLRVGHKNYVPMWTLLHKLRSIMGLRDVACQLVGHAEVDDAFYTTGSKDIDKDNLSRSRGSQRMTKVLSWHRPKSQAWIPHPQSQRRIASQRL